MRGRLCSLAALIAFFAAPASAQEPVRIGIGFGLAFLPAYICEDLKLVEKYGKELHLDVKASYQRYLGAGPMQQAISSGAIDVAPFGTAPLLAAWEETKGTPQQIFAVSGLTSMPLALLSNQSNLRTIADLKPTDRIAMPSLTAPQMYLLQMQAEKSLGQYDRLDGQVVALPPSDLVAALSPANGAGAVAAYFASPPYSELALRDGAMRTVLTSAQVMNGKSSFLLLGASHAYIESHPQIPAVIDKAMDEAARIIHDDPRRAAQIYLTHEPSRTLSSPLIEAVLKDIRDEFGSPVYGVKIFADFMGRHGELKSPPRSWKEIVAPALLNSPSS